MSGDLGAHVRGSSGAATKVTVADESTDTSCHVLFMTDAEGDLEPKTGTNLTFNANTGALSATSFSGTVATATTATNVTATANDSTNETVFPTFVDGQTGSQGIETDVGLTYNPSTGIITAGGFITASINSITATAEGTMTVANANRINLLAGTSMSDTPVTVTLPAATGTGHHYCFLVSVAAGNEGYTIQRTGDDTIHGHVYVTDNSDGSLLHVRAISKESLSLNGSNTGGIIGDYIELIDFATDKWFLKQCHLSSAEETSASSPLNE